MFNNIVCIGYRGVGKSTIARDLALQTKYTKLSTDHLFEEHFGNIKRFVEQRDWQDFRSKEEAIIANITGNNLIVDCGGGVVESEANRKALRRLGFIVWINVSEHIVLERLRRRHHTPALTDMPLQDEVTHTFLRRKPHYKAMADLAIDATDLPINEVVRRILRAARQPRLCVSLSATNFAEARAMVTGIERPVDLVELRLDYFRHWHDGELSDFIASTPFRVLATLRSVHQGGNYQGSAEQRRMLLSRAFAAGADLIDIEWGNNPSDYTEIPNHCKLLSCHDLASTPKTTDLIARYCSMAAQNVALIKTASMSTSITNALRTQLMPRSAMPSTCFAMGETGELTRIIGPKYGARLVFSALDDEHTTAPGQIPWRTLVERYNLLRIGQETKIFGIISRTPKLSMSPILHNALYKDTDINAVFVPFTVQEDDLVEFLSLFVQLGFSGAAVTMPFKEKIISHLSHLTPSAKAIGAVNTIFIEKNKLVGDNTDATGAIQALESSCSIAQQPVLVIGAGGAARAIVYGLMERNADVIIANRTEERSWKLAKDFGIGHCPWESMCKILPQCKIVVNTTSVGMQGHAEGSPLPIEGLHKGQVIMDIVYKPLRTPLVVAAEAAGCLVITGEKMLVFQALRQHEIWTGKTGKAETLFAAFAEYHNAGR